MDFAITLNQTMSDLTSRLISMPNDKLYMYGGLFALMFLVIVMSSGRENNSQEKDRVLPPVVSHTVPILGQAVAFGVQPVKFLQKQEQQHGDCFTFTMMGRKITAVLNPDGNHFLFNVKLADATAEGAYDKLTVPVFGDEVVYDVDNAVFMQQKKFIKDALTTDAFKSYVPIIMEETRAFFKEWPNKSAQHELFPDMAELTIRTASHCLLGKEIRQQLHSNVAKLYHDLDQGFQPINVFFKWLPLPAYFARDRANKIMTETFLKILQERRKREDFENKDILQSLMEGVYRDGTKMSDKAIAHMLIAALMAGQHTSSTTVSWIIFELANNPHVIDEILKEQSEVLTGKPDTPPHELPDFTYEELRKFTYLDGVMKESLRLHPPIHTIMRLVMRDVKYKGYTIPAGHFIAGSPAVSQMDPARFPDPEKFDPTRFTASADEGSAEWTINGVDIAQKSARSNFLPFGAGRHRCIGEAFAYVQIKTIIALFVREFRHQLMKDAEGKNIFPPMDFTCLIVMPKKPSYIAFERREEFVKKDQ
ncbi:cytochrome P450 [Fimicolochytrium jonesii]|uniref:cytochrome P450 n=1 Tax=Fimicolochytrium jonesii TaxID=1396493 RepID=UPI0022FDF5EC|nr:cytochrome P450 [Fimicolochytrium jonesii]KAI8823610.1 cytochrome P450 [Fimicolochytrium jonesii]